MAAVQTQIAELDKRIAVAERNLELAEKLEKTFNARFDKLEAKLNNGISSEIRKNTQFRKMVTWIGGIFGTAIFGSLAVGLWKLIINLDKLLEIANTVNK